MNRYVDILNRIRQQVCVDWLTPSQKQAYDKIRSYLQFADEVNLCGAHGSGKTFLAWVFQLEGKADYVVRLEKLYRKLSLNRTIVVDNVGWRRTEAREVLHRCRMLGYEKVILVSVEAVRDDIAHVSLSLTSEDVEKVQQNLQAIRVPPFADNPRSLWEIVSPLHVHG